MMKNFGILIAYVICFIVGVFFADSILALATYPYDVLVWIGMMLGFIYLARNEKDSIVNTFKDIHQSNLDDIEEQEIEKESQI